MTTLHPILQELQALSALPSPPQVALKIVEVTRDPDKGAKDLAGVLSTDPAISTKILQVANSTAYSRSREVTTIADAVNLLGMNGVSAIALGFSLKSAIPSFDVNGVNQDVLWKHSVAVGVLSRALSRVLGGTDDEVAFMCGLLSRIGQLVFLSAIPTRYAPVLENSNDCLPGATDEHEELGVTHHDVAGLLLQQWNLPESILGAVVHWEDESTEPVQPSQQLADIVAVADSARALLFEENKADCLERLHSLASSRCRLAPSEVDRVFVACQNELRETLAIFACKTADEMSCETILDMARDQMMQVSLKLASDLASVNHRCDELFASNSQLQRQSTTDGLTGLSNRYSLDKELEKLDEHGAMVQRAHYSIVMIDIDNFKTLNDTYGHSVGDQVLQTVGAALSEGARATDFVARYGGEEFTVILTNCNRDQAIAVAERFRRAVGSRGIELSDETIFVTASAGVATSDASNAGYEQIIKFADAALYEAKTRGRNQTVQFAEDSASSMDGPVFLPPHVST